MVAKATYAVHEERYLDCPHCGRLITDEGGSVPEIKSGSVIACGGCGKKIEITGGC